MSEQGHISIEVVYGHADDQHLMTLQVPENSTVWDAVIRSGMTERFPELDLDNAPMGIFSRVVANPKAHLIREGDRVEIYRPLVVDPMEARRARAAKVQSQRKRAKAD